MMKQQQRQYLCVFLALSSLLSLYHCQTTTIDIPKKTSSLSSSTCGVNGNTETICSPKSGDVWKNGTWYPITWNIMYPTYVAASSLDIYIYFVQNYQNVLIKKITDISTTKGTYPILVDDTWRLGPSAQTYESLIYIVSSGTNPEKELSNRFSDFPPPIHNFVEQLSLAPISTALPNSSSLLPSQSSSSPIPSSTILFSTPSPTLVNHVANKPSTSSHQDAHPIQPWVIVAVVLASLAVLGACIALVWVMHHSRKKRSIYGEKGHLDSSTLDKSKMHARHSSYSLSSPTIITTPTTLVEKRFQQHQNASTPTLQPPLYMLSDSMRPQSTSNISSRSEPPLSSTDALLIADTFRQRMRKPEWQKEEEETKRRELSELLLKHELEAEGTLMKKVGKRAHLLANTYQDEK